MSSLTLGADKERTVGLRDGDEGLQGWRGSGMGTTALGLQDEDSGVGEGARKGKKLSVKGHKASSNIIGGGLSLPAEEAHQR